MSKITARITAKGFHAGNFVIIECVEHDGDDDNERYVEVLKNGKEDFFTSLLFRYYIGCRYAHGAKVSNCYNPAENTAAAYWLALEKYFDEPPETVVEGEVAPQRYDAKGKQFARLC